MTVKYTIELQFADPNKRPEDPGPVSFGFESEGPHMLPNVGDYVSADVSMRQGESDDGRVRSRLFRYIGLSDDETHCHVNIVVERDKDARWDLLVKE